jgi:hypothetical protein
MMKIDVREAEAGPHVDAACAEVMEWRRGAAVDMRGEYLWDLWWRPAHQVGHTWSVAEWKPSRNIAPAWELVEAMLEQDDQQAWLVFAELLYEHTRVLVPEYLAALRIARAFLLANGVHHIEVLDED